MTATAALDADEAVPLPNLANHTERALDTLRVLTKTARPETGW